MSRIHGRDTKPELFVRKLVFSMGFRYRLHDKKLPGTPDIVFAGRRKVIMVHGCFWHGHETCKLGRPSKSNQGFWNDKIAKNRARDSKVEAQLQGLGWKVLTLWQCQLKDTEQVANAIQAFLK